MEPLTTEGKAQLAVAFQNLTAALDSTGACLFSTFGMGADELARMVSTLTGVPYPTEELLRVGERIWNLERLWNLKAGLTGKDDTLPDRILHESTFPHLRSGHPLDQLLPRYYKIRGWDEHGVPLPRTLARLQVRL